MASELCKGTSRPGVDWFTAWIFRLETRAGNTYMETSLFLAKIIGLVSVLSTAAILVRYKESLDDRND